MQEPPDARPPDDRRWLRSSRLVVIALVLAATTAILGAAVIVLILTGDDEEPGEATGPDIETDEREPDDERDDPEEEDDEDAPGEPDDAEDEEPEPEPEPTLPPISCPDGDTTGVPADAELEPSDAIETSEDGQVIENLEVTGNIEVLHDDVTIRNVRVLAEGHFGIYVPAEMSGDVEGLLIEDSEIVGVAGDRDVGLAQYGDWTARRVEISGFQDGVKMSSDQVLEDSWIHDLYSPDGAHNDGIQSVGGSGSVIRGNTVEGRWQGQTSAILIQTQNREIDDWVIEGNCLSGGGYTLYVEDKDEGHGEPTNVRVRDNMWIVDSWNYEPTRIDKGDGWEFEGNRHDDGTPLD